MKNIVALLALLWLPGCIMPGAARLFPENKNISADEIVLSTPYGTVTMKNVRSVVSSNFTGWPPGQTNYLVLTNHVSVSQQAWKLSVDKDEQPSRIHPTPRVEPED